MNIDPMSGHRTQRAQGRRAIVIIPVTIVLTALVSASVFLALRTWSNGGQTSLGTAASNPAATSSASTTAHASPTASPTATEDGRLTAREHYGTDRDMSFEFEGRQRADFWVRNRLDHPSCKGSGRSALGKQLFEQPACLYGIEQDLESKRRYGWVGQRIFVFKDEASAKRVRDALKKSDKSDSGRQGDVTFESRGLRTSDGYGDVVSYERCVAITVVTFDGSELRKLGQKEANKEIERILQTAGMWNADWDMVEEFGGPPECVV